MYRWPFPTPEQLEARKKALREEEKVNLEASTINQMASRGAAAGVGP
jgi:hypothetical protein